MATKNEQDGDAHRDKRTRRLGIEVAEEPENNFDGTAESGLDHLQLILINLDDGAREAFFSTGFKMMADRLRHTWFKNPGSLQFRSAKERAACSVLSILGAGPETDSDEFGWEDDDDDDDDDEEDQSQASNSQQSQPPMDLDNETDETEHGVHVLLSNMLQITTHDIQPELRSIEIALVATIKNSDMLSKKVRVLEATDPRIKKVQQGSARLRLQLGNFAFTRIRTEIGQLGKALEDLGVTPPGVSLTPVMRTEEDAVQHLSELEQQAFQNVQSGEKSVQKEIPCEVFVVGKGWRPAVVTAVDRDDDGEITTLGANVWETGNAEVTEMEGLERRSVVVQQLLPQKIDQASSAWFLPQFIMHVVESLNLFNDRTGSDRLVADQYDGSGLLRSERYNHNDLTLKGKQFYGGRYTDGSIMYFFIGMICTNKDSRRLFDAWICDQEKRWTTLFELPRYSDITRIAIYDLKALWDATRSTPITHSLGSCDDPSNNVIKRVSQMYDPDRHQMVCICVPNKTIQSITDVGDHASGASKYFNVDGPWALSCPPSHAFHDPLHYGRWCCQVLGNLLLGAYAAGGEKLMFQLMDHIQKCCGVELHHHHGIQVSATGKVTVTTRKGVGAVMRVCAHPNLVFNMRCECCQLQWPEEYNYILEALNIYMIVVQMIVVPWLRYDMVLQKEYMTEVIVLIDIKHAIECEIIGPHVVKISARLATSGAERLARILTAKKVHLAAVSAKPVETMHVPVAKYMHKSGANLGGARDVPTARERAARAVLCSCLLGIVQGQKQADKREKLKMKKEKKKNKDFWEPLMKRNAYFGDLITKGESIFDPNNWKTGQNLFRPGTFDIDNDEEDANAGAENAEAAAAAAAAAADLAADDVGAANAADAADAAAGGVVDGEDQQGWADNQFAVAAHEVEVDNNENASNSSKSIVTIALSGTRGDITFPLPLRFEKTVHGEGGALNQTTVKELNQYGRSIQTVDLYTRFGSAKLAIRLHQVRFDTAKQTIQNDGVGLQIIGTDVRIWYLDEVAGTLFINLKQPGSLLLDNKIAGSGAVDPTGGYFKSAFEIIAESGSAVNTTALKEYMEYLLGKNNAWLTSKATSRDGYDEAKELFWPEEHVGGVEDGGEEGEEGEEEILLTTPVSNDPSLGMRANSKHFMDEQVPSILFRRLDGYRTGSGDTYGWYGPWACPQKERAPKAPAPQQQIDPQEMTVDHLVTLHKTKTNGVLHQMIGNVFTADMQPGPKHTTCTCLCTTQPIRMNNGEYATDAQRKIILMGLGLPGNDPTPTTNAPRVRIPTAAQAQINAAGNGGVGVIAAVVNQTGTPAVANTTCLGVDNNSCVKKRSKKPDSKTPLGEFCTDCTRKILTKTVVDSKACLLKDDAAEGTEPAWWKEAHAVSQKAKPSVVKCRYQYCRCIMKGIEKALSNEINN